MTQYFNHPPRQYKSRYSRMLFDEAKERGVPFEGVDKQEVYIDGVIVEIIVTKVIGYRYRGMLFVEDSKTTVTPILE